MSVIQIISEASESIERAKKIVRALDHPLRVTILEFVEKKGSASVTEIFEGLGMDQSVASSHLALLKEIGVVTVDRMQKRRMYSVNDRHLCVLVSIFGDLPLLKERGVNPPAGDAGSINMNQNTNPDELKKYPGDKEDEATKDEQEAGETGDKAAAE